MYFPDTGRRCNCDANDPSRWYEDSGYVNEKSNLPIKKIYFGDTGGKEEEGYFTVGALRCYLSECKVLLDSS